MGPVTQMELMLSWIWRPMSWRMRLFTYLFAVLCGILISRIWDGNSSSPPGEIPQTDPSQAQMVELQARLLSEQQLRRQLEEQIAVLQAGVIQQSENEKLTAATDAVELADQSEESTPAEVAITRLIEGREDLQSALEDARFLAVLDAIAEWVKQGELDEAVEGLLFIESALQAPDGEGPLSGMEPLFEDVLAYWIPQVLASCQGAGDQWLQLFIKVRKLGWDGAALGPLLSSFQIDEFLTLATFSSAQLSEQTEANLLEHMRSSFEENGWLSQAELAAITRISGEPVVRFLEQLWDRSTNNRDGVISALTQVSDPSAEVLLRRILPEIRDLKLRSALEIWLNR